MFDETLELRLLQIAVKHILTTVTWDYQRLSIFYYIFIFQDNDKT